MTKPNEEITSVGEDQKMSDMEQRLEAEFDAWFKQLQALTDEELTAEDWTERWFDGYTPAEALADGPEDQ